MRFEKLSAYLDSLIDENIVPGCDLAVYQDHRPLFRRQAGFSDDDRTRPVRGDEVYWLFSCTKVVTTCAAMQLIEKGLLHPDDPVSDYLPAFASLTVREGDSIRPARRVMTVRHLMSMQSGLDYNLEKPAVLRRIRERNGLVSTRELVDAMAEEPLCFDPGEHFLYSLSHDVLAAVVEAVSGQRFSDYLKDHVFGPLHIGGFSFVLTDELRSRLSALYLHTENGLRLCPPDSNNYQLTPAYESGGAGLIADVQDYITFADALSCGGVGKDGNRILSPEMIQLWSANQLTPLSRQDFDAWKRLGYSYALGVRTRVDLSLGGPGSVGEFGWDGAAGAWTMIDPHLHLSAFFAMHVRGFGYSYDVIHPTLRRLIYEGLAEH